MPRFHHERDYLRLEVPLVDLDFDHITVHSDLSHQIKRLIEQELQEKAASTGIAQNETAEETPRPRKSVRVSTTT